MVAVARERKRRGLRALHSNALVCSDACRSIYRAKRSNPSLRAVIKLGRSKLTPLFPRRPGAWRCYECGATWSEALRKRRRQGLRLQLVPHQRTCTPACVSSFESRLNKWARIELKRRAARRRAEKRRAAARRARR